MAWGGSQPPNIEDLTAKEGTLKDAQTIADKVSEHVPPCVPFEGQQFSANFCAFCDGTPHHSPHECPARSIKAHRPCLSCLAKHEECTFIGLKVECTNCARHWGCTCVGGVPDHNILSFPFVRESDETIDSIMAKIDAMTLSTAPYGPIRGQREYIQKFACSGGRGFCINLSISRGFLRFLILQD
ncbi:hypothetical protein ARMGADRAFT_1079677 [Armillaria gallica]|uniref:Uncharacterized protein n=1 Tax=Armillaria gallica TaxID=47427 RepID=A0A2H3E0W3_ARMGA|nr:hypothetical protein ARMGADRAFT_1079677 [Armillaria gallica]